MKAYIRGIGNISPQKTFDKNVFLDEAVAHKNNMLFCVDPVYKEYINPLQLRRMSRTLRMGVTSAKICLADSGIEMPDAIITGTGFGCTEDTEKFLLAMLNNHELQLTPTAFMQSTHNTISGQVAIMLQCKGYNFTYVHRGASFEAALLDSLLLIEEGNAHKILVGGFDENSQNLHTTTGRMGHWKKENINSLQLLDSKTEGTVSGEGSAFFMLTDSEDENNYAAIKGLSIFYKPENVNETEQKLNEFLQQNNLKTDDIDLVVYGYNGDSRTDYIFDQIRGSVFQNTAAAYYKHLCGDYYTSTAFALWLTATAVKKQVVPDAVRIGNAPEGPIKNVLIFNHYRNRNYSFILVSQC